MAQLHLDFLPRRSVSALTLMLLLVAATGVALQLASRADRLDGIAEAQARVERLERAQAQVEGAHRSPRVAPAVEVAERALVSALAVTWEPLLDDLQRAAAGEVLLTQVQPGVDGKVSVSGRAAVSADYLAFLQRLRRRPGWRDVVPVSEVRGEPDMAGKPVAFQMVADYVGQK